MAGSCVCIAYYNPVERTAHSAGSLRCSRSFLLWAVAPRERSVTPIPYSATPCSSRRQGVGLVRRRGIACDPGGPVRPEPGARAPALSLRILTQPFQGQCPPGCGAALLILARTPL